MKRFSDDEIEIIRKAWADDTVDSPLAVASAQLDRSPASIQVYASNQGWSRERAERRHKARAEALAAADKAAKLAAATKAADAAKAAIAEAERKAKEAGIKPVVQLAPPERVVVSINSRPPRATVTPIRAGRCDRGDRATIFKRLTNFVIPQLAGELRRAPSDIEAAIATIAAGGFKPEVSKFGPDEWAPEESFHARKA